MKIDKKRLRDIAGYMKIADWDRTKISRYIDLLDLEMSAVIQAFADSFFDKDRLGLEDMDLVKLGLAFGSKPLAKSIEPLLPPKMRGESAPGTSFTSTANVAPYMVPVGAPAPGKKKKQKTAMLRRPAP